MIENLFQNIGQLQGFVLLLLVPVLLVLAGLRKGGERWLALSLAAATLGHLTLSAIGWYGHYHNYLVILNLAGLAFLVHWHAARPVMRAVAVAIALIFSVESLQLQASISTAVLQTCLTRTRRQTRL